MPKRFILALLIMLTASLRVVAQKKVREENWLGNRYYHSQKMTEAEVHYRKALEANPKDPVTLYNLSNLLYRTDRGEENGKLMQPLMEMLPELTPNQAADVAHNAGNSAMRRMDYEHAVEFYKESLRRRPTDDETRYNLALAQKLLEKQKKEQQQQQDQQQQQRNQQQQQDQQQQQQQQNQQQQQDQNKDNGKPDKPQDQPQDKKDQMSRQTAEQILKSYLQDEKKTRKKVDQIRKQNENGSGNRGKNW